MSTSHRAAAMTLAQGPPGSTTADGSLRHAFQIDHGQSQAFARLSGDFNPLHLDPIGARRTQFGSTVVHGVHAVLKALDVLVGHGLPASLQPDLVACTFSGPVRTGSTIEVFAKAGASKGRVHVIGQADGRSAFTVILEGRDGRASRSEQPAPLPDADWPPTVARESAALLDSGVVALRLDRQLLAELFPMLSQSAPNDWVAAVLATTRIVGMECPGLDSIYASFRLRRDAQTPGDGPRELAYRIASRDDRFSLVKLAVAGAGFNGTIDAFVRPQPVQQLPLRGLLSRVDASAFRGQRALVVGGSRGLGEVTAKILLAGGATVTITYAVGRAEAERTCAEARELGLQCAAVQFDVTGADAELPPAWLRTNDYTHVYYFASPHIGKNAARPWDDALFENLARVYVGAFAKLIEMTLALRAPQVPAARFLYPSTVYLDAPEAGFAEYAAAKAAGEAVARGLALRYAVTVVVPRLPRMQTDQTATLLGPAASDPVPILLEMVRQFVH